MDPNTNAQCSNALEDSNATQSKEHTETESILSKEICTKTIDLSVKKSSCINPPQPFHVAQSHYSYFNKEALVATTASIRQSQASVPLFIISRPPSLVIRHSNETPRLVRQSNFESRASYANGQPRTLFLQALAKLHETSLSTAVADHFDVHQITDSAGRTINIVENTELSTPDSLGSAPPSYSFVLRQIAVSRRRPRILGGPLSHFLPSPSFIPHSLPPNYNTSFDMYIENLIPPPSTRVYNFGFASMPVSCPECGYTGMTLITSKVTLCTHLCAVILCVLCCWVCAPLPYILRSCKDVYHYCANCRNYLGLYRPTNPENSCS